MSSLIQVEKEEWEAFLKKLSELQKKYDLVLRELDEAREKLEALEKSPAQKQAVIPREAQPAKDQPAQKPIMPEKSGMLTRLATKLESLRVAPKPFTNPQQITANAQAKYASCSRCGRMISHATRFCENCGADFGGLVCSCGRQLFGSDEFCDRCGRPVEAVSPTP